MYLSCGGISDMISQFKNKIKSGGGNCPLSFSMLSKTFKSLSDFIQNKMRMSHIYQRVMLIELLKGSGKPAERFGQTQSKAIGFQFQWV